MKFDVKKTVQYWIEGADYDLGVAEAMFEKRNLQKMNKVFLWLKKQYAKQ